MNQGKIEQVGSPQIYEQPRTPFVADFIGNTNFSSGLFKAQAQASRLLQKQD